MVSTIRTISTLICALAAVGCGDDAMTVTPTPTFDEVTQLCQQVDYFPGQPRTADWVSILPPDTEENPDDPQSRLLVQGHWVAVPIKPRSYPFTVRFVEYEVASSASARCRPQTPHRVELFLGSSVVPSNTPQVERTFTTKVEAGLERTLVRHSVDPPLLLEDGDVLFVSMEQAREDFMTPEGMTAGWACPINCRPGDGNKQLAFRSRAQMAPYNWIDISDTSDYRMDPTVPWISVLDGDSMRVVPNVDFDAVSDGSQDVCIGHIEAIGEGGFKCTVNHLCGDDSYRMTCLTPTTCACGKNGESGKTGIAKPEELCRLDPRAAEAKAIELCEW